MRQKISELITNLENFKKEFGDIDVVLQDAPDGKEQSYSDFVIFPAKRESENYQLIVVNSRYVGFEIKNDPPRNHERKMK